MAGWLSGEAAPLYWPADLPALTGASAEWFAGKDGVRLRAAIFPAQHPKGSVVFSAGRTEFIEKYAESIGDLVARGFTVLAHDWRGQGLSDRLSTDRLLGFAAGFDDFVADFGLLLDGFEARLAKPWIAVSHSMGACLTLLAMARGEGRVAGALLSAPMLGLKAVRNPLSSLAVIAMVRLGASRRYVARSRTLPGLEDFANNVLTHDEIRFRRCQALLRAHPELGLGGVSWGWVASAVAAIGWLRHTREVARLAVPVIAVAAEREALVDNAAAARLMARLPRGRYVRIKEARHELLMETDDIRTAFLREFDALAAELLPTNSGTPLVDQAIPPDRAVL